VADLGADAIAVSAPSDRLERSTGPAVGSFVSRQSGTAREVEERSGPG
jgi:hypothetical protein